MEIELKDIDFKYKTTWVFKNMNLNISSGEAVAFIGDNGCGKTTLLKLVAGFLPSFSGTRRIGRGDDFGKLFCGILESPRFWNHLSGRENVQYYLGESYDKAVIEKEFQRWNLLQEIDRRVKNYSLGMRQKLALILTFLSDASILVLDEPTNSLDQKSVELFYESVEMAKRQGKIILMTTHVLYDLETFCTRIYMIKNKKLELCQLTEMQNVQLAYEICFETNEEAVQAKKQLEYIELVTLKEQVLTVSPCRRSISDIIRMLSAYNITAVIPKKVTLKEIYTKNGAEQGGVC